MDCSRNRGPGRRCLAFPRAAVAIGVARTAALERERETGGRGCGKINRGPPFRFIERGQRERLLCRRHPG